MLCCRCSGLIPASSRSAHGGRRLGLPVPDTLDKAPTVHAQKLTKSSPQHAKAQEAHHIYLAVNKWGGGAPGRLNAVIVQMFTSCVTSGEHFQIVLRRNVLPRSCGDGELPVGRRVYIESRHPRPDHRVSEIKDPEPEEVSSPRPAFRPPPLDEDD